MMIIYNNWIPVKGYSAINIFGIVFARKEYNPLKLETITHERIHTAQMLETLFIPFYLIYGIHFIIQLFRYRDWIYAYMRVCFEQEAYNFQDIKTYIKNRQSYYWIHCL